MELTEEERKKPLGRNVRLFTCCHPLPDNWAIWKVPAADRHYLWSQHPTGTVCPETNLKMKAINSEVSPEELPFATWPFKTFCLWDKMVAFKLPWKHFLERKMLAISHLDTQGKKSNVTLWNSYQTDYPLEQFWLWYKQTGSCWTIRPWTIVPPVADEPYRWIWSGNENYFNPQIRKVQPHQKGGEAKALCDVKKGSQGQRRWESINLEPYSGRASLDISEQNSFCNNTLKNHFYPNYSWKVANMFYPIFFLSSLPNERVSNWKIIRHFRQPALCTLWIMGCQEQTVARVCVLQNGTSCIALFFRRQNILVVNSRSSGVTQNSD